MDRLGPVRPVPQPPPFSATGFFLARRRTAKMFGLFLICFAFLQELLYISLCGDKDCAVMFLMEPAWKYQDDRLTFNEIDNVFKAVHGMSCCHHCMIYNNFRLGKKVRDFIFYAFSWINHPFRISYQRQVVA
ncbi:uncharacterized protein LOC106884245 [Argonauta hians]